jgi:hypothetical protein
MRRPEIFKTVYDIGAAALALLLTATGIITLVLAVAKAKNPWPSLFLIAVGVVVVAVWIAHGTRTENGQLKKTIAEHEATPAQPVVQNVTYNAPVTIHQAGAESQFPGLEGRSIGGLRGVGSSHTIVQGAPATGETLARAVPATSRPTPPSLDERETTDVTPEHLHDLVANVTELQGEKLVADYLGKVMTLNGNVGGVGRWNGMICSAYLTHRPPGPMIFLWFREEKWLDRLGVLRAGDPIKVRGVLGMVDKLTVRLDYCELLES